MKEREILERVMNHFSQPGVKTGWDSVRRVCVYKTEDGGMCAIGCLVSPEWAANVAKASVSELTKDRLFDNFFNCKMSLDAMFGKSQYDKGWADVLTSLYEEVGTKNHQFLFYLQELHDEWLCKGGSTQDLVRDIRTLLNGGEFEHHSNWVITEAREILSGIINKK